MIEVGLIAALFVVDFFAGAFGMVTFAVLFIPYRMVLVDRSLYLVLPLAFMLAFLLEIWLVFPVGTFSFSVGLAVMGLWWAGGLVHWTHRNVRVAGWWFYALVVILGTIVLTFILTGQFPLFEPIGWLITLLLGSVILGLESSGGYRRNLWGTDR